MKDVRLQIAWLVAQRFLAERKAADPFWGEAQGFGKGGGSSSTSTKFERKGTGLASKTYNLPAELSSLITQAYATSPTSPALGTAENAFLIDLFGKAQEPVPGLNVLQALQALDPTNFTGTGALDTMVARNPYSQDYEQATGELYDRSFGKARAEAQSGPQNVRGAQARQGFELADVGAQQSMNRFKEIRAQQDKEAGVVQNAVQLSNMIENLRRGTQLQSQQQEMGSEGTKANMGGTASEGASRLKATNTANLSLAGELLGSPVQTTKDDFTGKGAQVGKQSSWESGITCCFIFLEALNGELPDYVRQCRDIFGTENRKRGYVMMSSWLVPMMKRSKGVRRIVNMVMIQPFLKAGAGYIAEPNVGWWHAPVPWMWFMLWSLLGWLRKGK